MGNKPLPNARPLLQRQKDHQEQNVFVSVNVIVILLFYLLGFFVGTENL